MNRRSNRPDDVWRSIAVGLPDACWPWIAAPRSSDGYGSMRLQGKQVLAHRIVYELVTGIKPGDMIVMHSCDNPPCCNPAHLRLGTVAENNRDRKEKGRSFHLQGSKHGQAKLTEDNVREIRRRCANGESQVSVADIFGVSFSRISQLVREPDRNWSHV